MKSLTKIDRLMIAITALGFKPYLDDDGNITLDAELGDGCADFTGGENRSPWIHPCLERLAEKAGGWWDWLSPVELSLVLDAPAPARLAARRG